MTLARAVAEINAIHHELPEEAHCRADRVIDRYLEDNGAGELVQALNRLASRCRFWTYG
jgi:hypothetical protein